MQPLSKVRRHVFWAAPPPADSEFTPEDPLALDYLNQQVGLWLLPRLTTRTNRAQYYAVVLYGLHLARVAANHYGLPSSDEQLQELFERWERFWALSVLESRGGGLPRGDDDSMRGIRGATAVWRDGAGKLPLDYPLISRQAELGGLGAYLTSLRATGLVLEGTLRPSPASQDVLDAFWGERTERDHRGRYEDFALHALDPSVSKLTRKRGNLTLGRVGAKSRLTAIRGRQAQQQRLLHRLVGDYADANTRALARLVRAAWEQELEGAREILTASIDGELGDVDGELLSLLRGARAYGDAAVATLSAFQRVFRSVRRGGWMLRADKAAQEAFEAGDLAELQRACRELLDQPITHRLRGLPVHGASFTHLARNLADASPNTALEALLAHHRKVQRDRRHGGGWLVSEGERLVIGMSSYEPPETQAPFPDLKLWVLRTLLRDLGSIPLDREEEAA